MTKKKTEAAPALAPVASRRRMPAERRSTTKKFEIRAQSGTIKGYLTVGFYEDGTVGEIFVKLDKQGSEVSGLMDAWAIAVSMLLQSGTPLTTVIQKFRAARFEPSGFTGDKEFPMVTSPIDYVCRYLEKYVEGSR